MIGERHWKMGTRMIDGLYTSTYCTHYYSRNKASSYFFNCTKFEAKGLYTI